MDYRIGITGAQGSGKQPWQGTSMRIMAFRMWMPALAS